MKKFISIIMAVLLTIGCLAGCGSEKTQGVSQSQSGKIQIVTTIFPEYDWVMEVLGENPAGAEVTMLLDNGVDLHSFQPTAADILKISTCDLFVYVGGESDEWVEDALKEATSENMAVINLMDVLGGSVKEEEVVEGMQEEDYDHGDEDGDGSGDDSPGEDVDADADGNSENSEDSEDHGGEEGEIEYDEHVWLSLRNASAITRRISEVIQTIDPENAETYKNNAENYIAKLNALDAEYQAAVDGASHDTLLFGDRFPFRYLTDDYGLNYYAAFVGCSAETEASFETITFLSQKTDELSLPAVMTIEGTDHRIAETIVQNTKSKNQQILTMDSMQSTTAEDVQNGASYLSIMENNLSVLKNALK